MSKYETIIVETVGRCNLSCIMCPTLAYDVKGKAIMSEETFSRIVPYFRKASFVEMTGWGEPLLDKAIFKRVKQASKSGCTVNFCSNGTLLTEEKSGELLQSGLNSISFSFDGGSKETYESIRKGASFTLVINNIKRLISMRDSSGSGLKVNIAYVLMRSNESELKDFMRLMQDVGVDSVGIKPLDVVWTPENKKLILSSSEIHRIISDIYKQHWKIDIATWNIFEEKKPVNDCMALATKNPFIIWDGLVSPCCALAHPVPRVTFGLFADKVIANTKYVVGDINKDSLDAIWEKKEYVNFRKKLFKKGTPFPCKGCNLL